MLSLSVVIPAFNEEDRIKPFLEQVLKFQKKAPYLREIIVVNDGSTDGTLKLLKGYGSKIRSVSYSPNRGKGYAVKKGILAATQEAIVFLDADGSTSANEFPKMVKALEKYQFVTGSRALPESNIVGQQPFQRVFAGKTFNLIVRLLFRTGINDSLCGFKGFRKDFGKKLARQVVSNHWVFDVEMFVRAKKMGVEIGVIPITWTHVGNAKMSLGWTTVKMLLGLLRLKLALLTGRISVPD